MSEIQLIQSTLERTARRRRWQRGWRTFWQGLFAGAALWLFVLGLYKLRPLPEPTLTIAALAAAALMPIGFLIGFWRKPSLVETARWVDERQHLQERLSTALEVVATSVAETWQHLVLSDAARRVQIVALSLAANRPLVAVVAGAGVYARFRSGVPEQGLSANEEGG